MADMSKTIKELSDIELSQVLVRIEKVRRLQSLIANIIRDSRPVSEIIGPYGEVTIAPVQVSTEQPIDTMYHHGVPGMRWGVRKKRSVGGGDSVKTSHGKGSEDHQRMQELKKKRVKDLTNEELKALTKRQQLVKTYKELNPSDIKRGEAIVKALTGIANTANTAYAVAKSPLVQDLIKAAKKKK